MRGDDGCVHSPAEHARVVLVVARPRTEGTGHREEPRLVDHTREKASEVRRSHKEIARATGTCTRLGKSPVHELEPLLLLRDLPFPLVPRAAGHGILQPLHHLVAHLMEALGRAEVAEP